MIFLLFHLILKKLIIMIESFVIHVLTNCIILVLVKRSFRVLKMNKFYVLLSVLYLSYLIYDVYGVYQ